MENPSPDQPGLPLVSPGGAIGDLARCRVSKVFVMNWSDTAILTTVRGSLILEETAPVVVTAGGADIALYVCDPIALPRPAHLQRWTCG